MIEHLTPAPHLLAHHRPWSTIVGAWQAAERDNDVFLRQCFVWGRRTDMANAAAHLQRDAAPKRAAPRQQVTVADLVAGVAQM
jgi:hypothetical protein